MKLSLNDPLAARAKPAVIRPTREAYAESLGEFAAQVISKRTGAKPTKATVRRVVDRALAEPNFGRMSTGLQLGIALPLRLGRGQNDREHHMARARRVEKERQAVASALYFGGAQLEVTLTRIAPSKGLDGDNCVSSLKACRDEVAHWLGIDDGDQRLHFVYEQERGPWAVRIEVRLVGRVT